jgi:hypothetical protein
MARGRGPLKMSEALMIKDVKVRRFDNDILVRGYTDY